MKSLRTVSLFFLFLAITLPFSEARAQNSVSFGVKGGLNFSTIDGPANFSDFDRRTGVEVGAVMELNFPFMPFGVETGVYYTQKGTSITVPPEQAADGSLSGDLTYRMDYIQVPLLARLWIGSVGVLEPHILVGPYAAYLIDSENDAEDQGTEDLSDDRNTIDTGFVGGLGVDFNLGLTRFTLQGKFTYGLTDVFETVEAQNRVFSVVAGFTF